MTINLHPVNKVALKKPLLFATGAVLLTFSTNLLLAASFDCSKAVTISEKIICGSMTLSSYDEKLNQLYQSVIKRNPEKKVRIKREQIAWIKLRDECNYSFDCIHNAYQIRFDTLEWYKRLNAKAFSWGGKIREQPAMDAKQIGSTYEQQAISVIEKTDITMNHYSWFKISVDGKEGYQWGGILCSPSHKNASFCQTL